MVKIMTEEQKIEDFEILVKRVFIPTLLYMTVLVIVSVILIVYSGDQCTAQEITYELFKKRAIVIIIIGSISLLLGMIITGIAYCRYQNKNQKTIANNLFA